jgi:hypothetical protein
MIISLRKIGALVRLLIIFAVIMFSGVQLLSWFFQWLMPFKHSTGVKGSAVFVSTNQQTGSGDEPFDPLERLKWFYLTGE